jgi:hypothetical protein
MSKPTIVVGIIGVIIIILLSYLLFIQQKQIDENLNYQKCDLAKTITRIRSTGDLLADLKALELIFDDITEAVNEKDFWFFPDTPASLLDQTVMIQDFVSENNYIKAINNKYGKTLSKKVNLAHLLKDANGNWNATKIVENNCN